METTETVPPSVVCDAGPVIHLDELGCLDLLNDFARLFLPAAVGREIARHRPAALRRRGFSWRHATARGPTPAALRVLARVLPLHRGEVEALPDSRLVHVRELYIEAERKTSATYNEALRLTGCQDSLNLRLVGPGGTYALWQLGDPVDEGGWGTGRTRMIERLLPHVRQCLAVRYALHEAGVLGESIAWLLDVAGIGVIHLTVPQRRDLARPANREY